MNLNQYLNVLVSQSNIFEKATVYETTTVLWTLKEGADKEEAEKSLDEIKKTIKKQLPSTTIEFKIVNEGEIVKQETIYLE